MAFELLYRLSNTILLRHLSASLFNAVRLLHVLQKTQKKIKKQNPLQRYADGMEQFKLANPALCEHTKQALRFVLYRLDPAHPTPVSPAERKYVNSRALF